MPIPPEPNDSGWFSGKALCRQRRHDRGFEQFGESLKLLPSLAVMNPLAGHDDRALGLNERGGDLRDGARVRAALEPRVF